MKGVQKVLQDELRGSGIEFFLSCPPVSHASGAQARVGFDRTESLVDEMYGQMEASVQLIGKTSAVRLKRVFAFAVERARKPYDEGNGLPFFDQAGDGIESRGAGFEGDGAKRAGKAGFNLAGGDADAGQTEVEAEKATARGQAGRRGVRGGRALRHARQPR